MTGFRGAAWLAAVGLVLASACAEDELAHKPVTTSSGDGGDGGTGTGGGDGGPLPSCMANDGDSAGDSAGSGADDGGFKFDVGAADGGNFEFPVSCDEVADGDTNLGCTFWAVDLPNDGRGTDSSPPAADQQFAVVVANASSLEPAEVSVYAGADADMPIDIATVEVDAIHTFHLDGQSIDPFDNSYDGVAFRIESDRPITAYQYNPLDNNIAVYSNDASVLFPDHALARDYTAVSGNAVLLAMSPSDPDPYNAGAFVSIVGTRDDTVVDVFPRASLYAGETRGVELGKGQVMTLLSNPVGAMDFGNVSGTRVAATKRVAVFSGNVATVEPMVGGGGQCCADHLEHQMLPLEAWGLEYAVAPPPTSSGDGDDPAVYRLTGSFDGTQLHYCPRRPQDAPVRVDAYQTITFAAEQPFTVLSLDPDKPFSITQFLESAQATGRTDGLGDPAMIALPAANQFQIKHLFAVPDGYAANFVTIVRRGAGEVRLDGTRIPEAEFTTLGVLHGTDHTYVHIPVDAGSHRVTSLAPIGITVIGYDDYVSYGFPGGLGLRVVAPPPPTG